MTATLLLLSPLKLDADTATRFLRAKRGDPAAAAGMFRAHLEWRKSERVDALWKEPPLPPRQEKKVASVFEPRLLDGHDALDRPILYLEAHDLDLPELEAAGITEKLLLRRYVRTMERVINALDHSPRPLGGHLAIFDVRHVTVVGAFRMMNLWIAIGRTLEANYPETLGQLVVVGCPAGADWVLSHVKSLMNERTGEKIRLHTGTRANDVRRALSQYLPPEVLFRASVDIPMVAEGANGSAAAAAAAAAEDDEVDGVTDAEIIASGREMLGGS